MGSRKENDSKKEEIVEELIASNKNQKKDFKNKKSKFKNKKKKCFPYDKEGCFKKDCPSKSRFNEWNKHNADAAVAQEGYDNAEVLAVSEEDSQKE